MKRIIAATMGVMAMLGVGGIGAITAAPTASAECGNFMMWGNGGGNCDGPIAADGSFQRCTTVFVFGIGGTHCFTVPGPPPVGPPQPAPPMQPIPIIPA